MPVRLDRPCAASSSSDGRLPSNDVMVSWRAFVPSVVIFTGGVGFFSVTSGILSGDGDSDEGIRSIGLLSSTAAIDDALLFFTSTRPNGGAEPLLEDGSSVDDLLSEGGGGVDRGRVCLVGPFRSTVGCPNVLSLSGSCAASGSTNV